MDASCPGVLAPCIDITGRSLGVVLEISGFDVVVGFPPTRAWLCRGIDCCVSVLVVVMPGAVGRVGKCGSWMGGGPAVLPGAAWSVIGPTGGEWGAKVLGSPRARVHPGIVWGRDTGCRWVGGVGWGPSRRMVGRVT